MSSAPLSRTVCAAFVALLTLWSAGCAEPSPDQVTAADAPKQDGSDLAVGGGEGDAAEETLPAEDSLKTTATVPRGLVGLPLDVVLGHLDKAGLPASMVGQPVAGTGGIEEGEVLSLSPASGSVVAAGTEVRVVYAQAEGEPDGTATASADAASDGAVTSTWEDPARLPLYQVTDVPGDDVLNVRVRAGVTHAILHEFAPWDRNIERTGHVTQVDGAEWWEISYALSGQVGWVHAGFLEYDGRY